MGVLAVAGSWPPAYPLSAGHEGHATGVSSTCLARVELRYCGQRRPPPALREPQTATGVVLDAKRLDALGG